MTLNTCLVASIPSGRRFRFPTVIMVDNNSTDGAPDMVAERYPWVKLIRSSDNLGFAAGCNLAARHATGEYYLLLNSDTILQTDVLDAVTVLDQDARVGAIGD